MHRAPLGKFIGQHAPLAAAPEQVQHRAEHLVQVYSPGTGFSARAFQQRLDDFELIAADVARVALCHLLSFSYAWETLNTFLGEPRVTRIKSFFVDVAGCSRIKKATAQFFLTQLIEFYNAFLTISEHRVEFLLLRNVRPSQAKPGLADGSYLFICIPVLPIFRPDLSRVSKNLSNTAISFFWAVMMFLAIFFICWFLPSLSSVSAIVMAP